MTADVVDARSSITRISSLLHSSFIIESTRRPYCTKARVQLRRGICRYRNSSGSRTLCTVGLWRAGRVAAYWLL